MSVGWTEAAHHWDGREGQTPRYLILHGTAGFTHAQDVANFFAQASTEASAHYVIGTDGAIVQCVNEEDAAWANGPISGPPGTSGDGVHHDSFWDSGVNPNLVSIAIEHVKPHQDNSDTLTDAQKQASFALILDICQRWNIPMHSADASGGITGHYSMDPVNRSRCPGPYPWNELWTFLERGGKMGLPNGWKDDGTTLTYGAFKVVAGFRKKVLAGLQDGSWRGDDVPCENEHAANPMEYSNPTVKAGNKQRFIYSTLEYNDEKGVFQAYNGPELIKLEQIAIGQKSQIDVLTAQLLKVQASYDALLSGSALTQMQADMHEVYLRAAKYEVKP